MDKINFNDYDVSVEIYDSVIAKWANTDYGETDPSSMTYLRNRDKIQPKLVAGTNIIIDPVTNEISSDLRVDQVEQLISKSNGNEVTLGGDKLLYVSFSGLLRNRGSVLTRGDLPDEGVKVFDSYYIEDESLYVFAHSDVQFGIVWLPLSFYVDMSLYVSKAEQSETLKSYPTNDDMREVINAHNTAEDSHPYILQAIDGIRQDMSDKEHFRGYYSTNAEVLAIPNPESGDFAYSAESGTKWIYDISWTDSKVVVPDQMVPPSDDAPLMDGDVAKAGVSNKYSRGDHVHEHDVVKLDKVTGASSSPRAYCVDSDGSQVVVPVYQNTPQSGSLVRRTATGTVRVEDPTDDKDAVNLGYLDSVAETKVDKIITGNKKQLYGVSEDNAQTSFELSDEATKNTVVQRSSGGAVRTATPVGDLDAANKKYVDDKFAEEEPRELDGQTFATYDNGVVGGVEVKAIGNTQLLIKFTPKKDMTQADTPLTVFSNIDSSIIPSLGIRFGQIWDYAKVEQVGFCVIDSDGDISVNAVATMFAGTQYTLLV